MSATQTRTETKTVETESNGKAVLDKILSLADSTAREIGMSRSELQLVKDIYAKNSTDQELAHFIRTSHRLKLSIEARQIFLVKRWDSSLKREVATPQVSIDGQRLVAERTGDYVPGRAAEYEYRNDRLYKATAYLKKFAKGGWHEVEASAFYEEYVQTTKEGSPNSMWRKYPHVMLAKCAESLALRKAFPNDLSGVYTDVEMGTDDADVIGGPIEAVSPAEPPRRATKSQLIEEAKQEEPPLTELEAVRLEQIKSLMIATAYSQSAIYKAISSFTGDPAKRETGYLAVLRAVAEKVVSAESWPYHEEGTLEFLEGFGITAISEASAGQLEQLIEQMKLDSLIV